MVASALVLALTSCSTFHGSNDTDDPWFADDKAKHFTLSAASGFGTTYAARAAGVESTPAAAGGFTVTISLGLIKEWSDATTAEGTGWSWKDLVWDLAGTAAGTWAGTAVPVPR